MSPKNVAITNLMNKSEIMQMNKSGIILYDMSVVFVLKQPPEMFLRKDVLKIYNKFKGEHPCRSVILKILPCSFIKIAFNHGCSPVNLLHIFKTPLPKNTLGRLLLFRIVVHKFITQANGIKIQNIPYKLKVLKYS